ncbi:MAG: caspase family protein [Bacteroidota bacterium]
MPKPFHSLSLAEFKLLLDDYPFTRQINEVHMHHTWIPNHAQDRGLASVEAMWRYHTQHLGWSDIAQHLTIDKHGTLWTGRDWNAVPASAGGFNGNRAAGPFMFEMIGDFDLGRDPFEDPQRDATLKVIALVQRRFGLPPEALKFHREMGPKTCPGTAIDKGAVLDAVRAIHAHLDAADQEDEPITEDTLDELGLGLRAEPFGPDMLAVPDIIADLTGALQPTPIGEGPRGRSGLQGPDPADAELPDQYTTDEIIMLTGGAPMADTDTMDVMADLSTDARGGGSGGDLTADMLDELQPHVINLTQGRFSSTGTFQTTEDDLERIFEEMLPKALQTARELGEPLHLVFYAHGGLVKENDALRTAHRHLMWWRQAPNVYPIHFVWETGLPRILWEIVSGWVGRREVMAGTRGITDGTDWLIERLLDKPGERVWRQMKDNARFASTPSQPGAPGGDAAVVAEALGGFVRRFSKAFNDGEIQLHAVGHSAGAVFHNYFVPVALAKGAKRFKSLHYMAPAVRVDRFQDYVGALVGKTVDHCTIYTMTKHQELDDDCITLYRKSLLYLIYYALEDRRKTPILGLDVSLRSDDALKTLFGLNGRQSDVGEVVFSNKHAPYGPRSSRALSHGAFDTDPWTLHSLFRRIVGRAPEHEFQAESQDRSVETFDAAAFEAMLLDGLGVGSEMTASSIVPTHPTAVFPLPSPPPPPRPSRPDLPVTPLPSPPISLPPISLPPTSGGGQAPPLVHRVQGRRIALCVGIDAYPQDPLSGCVNDVRAWAQALRARGFDTTLMTDGQATYDGLVGALQRLVAAGEPGDVLVFQFAGHGTFFLDTSGDEATGEDQAFCPVDFRRGATLLDDEVRELYAQLAPGVNLTSFIDCCHSGSITRLALSGDRRVRSVSPNTAMWNFRAERRRALAGSRAVGSRAAMRDVAFSAAQPDELAFETGGQGDFTRRALRVLGRDGAVTNRAFHDAVVAAFGPSRRQTPFFDAPDWAHDRPLLAPYPIDSDDENPADLDPLPFSDPALVESVLAMNRKLDQLLSRL